MFHPELNTLAILAELFRASVGTGDMVQKHVDQSLADLSQRNTISLSSGLETSTQAQGIVVDCPWISSFPDGLSTLKGAELPPKVICTITPSQDGDIPTFEANINFPDDDKAHLAVFSFPGSDAIIVLADPNNVEVNLLTQCWVGGINQWIGRSFKGFIWQSGNFIEDSVGSGTCSDGINNSTTISILGNDGIEREVKFVPDHGGNQGAFYPFTQNEFGTYKVVFNPNDQSSSRTIDDFRLALAEQLSIAAGKEVEVYGISNFISVDNILQFIPLPTPTPEATMIPIETPAPTTIVYIAPKAEIVTEIEQAVPEIINYPNDNIGLELMAVGKNVTIYREDPNSTDKEELANYLSLLVTTIEQQPLNNQFARVISASTFREWFKGLFGWYKPSVTKVEDSPITLSKIIHINFDHPSSRNIQIDGFDTEGKFVRINLPLKHNFTVQEGGAMLFNNGTLLEFTATDTTGAPDEASQTLARLVEQIESYPNIGSAYATLPEVVIVPMEAVLPLYNKSSDRNNIGHDARSLRENYPTVDVIFKYYDSSGTLRLIPNFKLPTGIMGTVKQLLFYKDDPLFEIQISLKSDLVEGNILSPLDRNYIIAQLPQGFPSYSDITIYISSDLTAAIPGPKFNPRAPLPSTPILDLSTPTPTTLPIITSTELPKESRFPSGDEVHGMDPRMISTP